MRAHFGGQPILVERNGDGIYRRPLKGYTFTAWDAETGGNQWTDLEQGGVPVTAFTTSPADRALPDGCKGPPDVDAVWLDSGDGTRELVRGTFTAAGLSATYVGRVTTAAQETATLDADIATSTGWTLGTGWTGDFAAGFTHTPGNTAPLTWTPTTALTAGTYVVSWEWDGTSTDQDVYAGYDVTLSDGSAGIIYQGGAPDNAAYTRAIKVTTNGDLAFAPWSTFDGRIHTITVKRLGSPQPVVYGWTDSVGHRTSELRFGNEDNQSLYLGTDSGKWAIDGARRNVGVGVYAMANNVTGFFNTALGYYALNANVNGTRNVAIGYSALQQNTSGDRNVGIGPFALNRVTTGQRNVAIGVDNFWRLEDGDDNIGVGYLTATEIEHGDRNIAIGKYAMRDTNGASGGGTVDNIAIGTEALRVVLGEGNIAIGRRSMASSTTATQNLAIGDYSLEHNTTAVQQTAVGRDALRYFTGGRNTALGYSAMKGSLGASTGTRNVAIGDNAGTALTTGSNNTIVGPSAGYTQTTGTNNIMVGFAAIPTAATASNELNIGATLYGDLTGKRLGIGIQGPYVSASLDIKAGTASAGTAPIKFRTGTLLASPEPGAIEYDGTNLYFTDSTSTRRTLAVV